MLGFYLKYDMTGCTLVLPCLSYRRQENIFLSVKKEKGLKVEISAPGREADIHQNMSLSI